MNLHTDWPYFRASARMHRAFSWESENMSRLLNKKKAWSPKAATRSRKRVVSNFPSPPMLLASPSKLSDARESSKRTVERGQAGRGEG